MSRQPIRILLADDHANVRTQIHQRLSREPDFQIVGEAVNSGEAMRLADSTQPQVVLMDPIMRDGRGLLALSYIAEHLASIPIIVLMAFADTAMQMELKRLGVCCILDKGIASEQLIETVRKAGQAISAI